MFISNPCSHSFCNDCIGKYVKAKIHENIAMVKCPDVNCNAALEPQFCRSIVLFHRLFCAQCRVAWHAGISCSEFRNLGKARLGRPREDIMVVELGKNMKWRRGSKFLTSADLLY
ncbi:uncharacterized protein LOC108465606 [Gossypium arboreum]|uniref:uncharacterized protein LOC108465606 n=1 Tax=Gossypium arboreum TaxID=29729 RepID=UPI0022F14907|nr:uncharacterized protein LOC108465606 [Gossypium arboreum]